VSYPNYVRKLMEEVLKLKERRKAVILAHNYQLPEVQDVADFVGDSLELARKALTVDADVIVFAGVSFMAEMVAALNPDKVVLHPDPRARCLLADMLTPEHVRRVREESPNTPLILYVNSPTELKALADYVVTSSSAAKLVSKLGVDEVILAPDKNLADYVAQVTGVKVKALPKYGHCPIHENLISRYYVEKALSKYPGAKVIIHPEAPRDARELAVRVGSTSQMLKAIPEVGGGTILLGTEEGLTYRARKLYPNLDIKPLNPIAVCTDMKKIHLLNIKESLEKLRPRVELSRDVLKRVKEVIEESLRVIGK